MRSFAAFSQQSNFALSVAVFVASSPVFASGMLFAGDPPPESLWTQTQQLVPSDVEADDKFGTAMAISGTTLVFGSEFDSVVGTWSGSVYVYDDVNGTWGETTKLQPLDAAERMQFGHAVAIDGDVMVVSGWGDKTQGLSAGAAYVFRRTNGVWAQEAKLLASGGMSSDAFGESVAISGDTILIGASGVDGAGSSSGAAYVFEHDAGTWRETAKLVAGDGEGFDLFGKTVALVVDTAVIGATGDDDMADECGAAYVFTRASGLWSETQKLLPLTGTENARFGHALSIESGRVLIGAMSDWGIVERAGSAYLFEETAGVWTQTANLFANNGKGYTRFGISVALSGDTALIGATFSDIGGIKTGSAYIFESVQGVWQQADNFNGDTSVESDQFGFSVALAQGTAIVGAWLVDGPCGGSPSCKDTGAVYVFGTDQPCYADCDQSTGVGILDVFDFLCFQDKFVSGDPYACDCDTSTGGGVCDVFDFLCFQNSFVAGCP